MPVDRLAAIEMFVRVVESGSLSAVARSAGITPSAVSKAIAALERRLGARLLNRTTRSLSPTPAGTAYYERCKLALAEIGEAEREVRFGQSALHGRLKVNTSALLALHLVLPALLDFARLHPDVQPELIMDDRRIDPVAEDADIIVRLGTLTSSSLVARRAGSAAILLCASPGYLGAQPAITGLADLKMHRIIGLTTALHVQRGPSDGNEIASALFAADNPILVSSAILAKEAALRGVGLAILPTFIVKEELATGRLVHADLPLDLPRVEVALLHPFGRRPPARVSAFIQHAVELWRAQGDLTT